MRIHLLVDWNNNNNNNNIIIIIIIIIVINKNNRNWEYKLLECETWRPK